MPNVHRKNRKQFAVRLTDAQREVFELTRDAIGAKDLSDMVIRTIMERAKLEGIQVPMENSNE